MTATVPKDFVYLRMLVTKITASDMEFLTKTRNYEHFDPEWYVDNYFARDEISVERKVDLDVLFTAFKTCKLTGKRLLDIGTGPIPYTVLTASKHVDEIYLSDYPSQNRDYLEKWLKNEKHIPKSMVEYLVKQEGCQLTAEERENQVRQKVNGILPVDVTAARPLGTWDKVSAFDIIVSGHSIECAVTNVQEYSKAVQNVAALLKKDGHLVLLGGFGLGSSVEPLYKMGEYAFVRPHITRDVVMHSLADAGLKVKFYHEIMTSEEDRKLEETEKYFYLVANY